MPTTKRKPAYRWCPGSGTSPDPDLEISDHLSERTQEMLKNIEAIAVRCHLCGKAVLVMTGVLRRHRPETGNDAGRVMEIAELKHAAHHRRHGHDPQPDCPWCRSGEPVD